MAKEATSKNEPLMNTSPFEQDIEPLRPKFTFAPRLTPDKLAQWRKGRERMRSPVTRREERVQDETQGVDAEVPSVKRDQHIESGACGGLG